MGPRLPGRTRLPNGLSTFTRNPSSPTGRPVRRRAQANKMASRPGGTRGHQIPRYHPHCPDRRETGGRNRSLRHFGDFPFNVGALVAIYSRSARLSRIITQAPPDFGARLRGVFRRPSRTGLPPSPARSRQPRRLLLHFIAFRRRVYTPCGSQSTPALDSQPQQAIMGQPSLERRRSCGPIPRRKS